MFSASKLSARRERMDGGVDKPQWLKDLHIRLTNAKSADPDTHQIKVGYTVQDVLQYIDYSAQLLATPEGTHNQPLDQKRQRIYFFLMTEIKILFPSGGPWSVGRELDQEDPAPIIQRIQDFPYPGLFRDMVEILKNPTEEIAQKRRNAIHGRLLQENWKYFNSL